MSRSATSSPVRDLALVATFAGVIAALSLVPALYLFSPQLPVTLQTLGVMLAGCVLGRWRGASAALLYLALGAVGLPVFAGGAGGLAAFAGPTGGFLIGFPVGAFVAGACVEASRRYRVPLGVIGSIVGGVLAVYAFGVPYLAWKASLPLSDALALMLPFLAGDALKAVLAALIAHGVHTAFPELLFGQRASRTVHPTSV